MHYFIIAYLLALFAAIVSGDIVICASAYKPASKDVIDHMVSRLRELKDHKGPNPITGKEAPAGECMEYYCLENTMIQACNQASKHFPA
ncbi:hypothetical protein BJX76DRAFT_363156 [Aspergillus varians]